MHMDQKCLKQMLNNIMSERNLCFETALSLSPLLLIIHLLTTKNYRSPPIHGQQTSHLQREKSAAFLLVVLFKAMMGQQQDKSRRGDPLARIIKGSEVSGDRPRQMTLWIGTQIRLQWAMYRKHQAIIAGFKASASREARLAQSNPYQISKKQQIRRGGSLKPERKSLNNHLGNWSLSRRGTQRINARQRKVQAIRRLNQILLMRLIKRMHQGWKLRNLLMSVTIRVRSDAR